MGKYVHVVRFSEDEKRVACIVNASERDWKMMMFAEEMFELLKVEMPRGEMDVQLNSNRPEKIKELIRKIEGDK